MEASVLRLDDEDGSGSVMRVGTYGVGPLVRFVEWLFSPSVPGFNLCMALWSLFWGGLMVIQPDTFDSGRFAGMRWMSDAGWIAFFAALTVLHTLACRGTVRPALRITADLLTAWIWLSVAASFLRIEIQIASYTPGTLIYVTMGFAALAHGIYCAGLPRTGG